MKKYTLIAAALILAMSGYAVSKNNNKDIEDYFDDWFDNDDYYGLVVEMPEGNIGEWTIGDRKFDITSSTKLDAEDGPIQVGTCVEVDFEDNVVEEIESRNNDRCSQFIVNYWNPAS